MIPRCLYDGVEEVVTSYTLHKFGDNSEKAFFVLGARDKQ